MGRSKWRGAGGSHKGVWACGVAWEITCIEVGVEGMQGSEISEEEWIMSQKQKAKIGVLVNFYTTGWENGEESE